MGYSDNCPLKSYCLTQKHEYQSCDDMVRLYNAGLLLPPEFANYRKEDDIICDTLQLCIGDEVDA